jgi:hypothetical protein
MVSLASGLSKGECVRTIAKEFARVFYEITPDFARQKSKATLSRHSFRSASLNAMVRSSLPL